MKVKDADISASRQITHEQSNQKSSIMQSVNSPPPRVALYTAAYEVGVIEIGKREG